MHKQMWLTYWVVPAKSAINNEIGTHVGFVVLASMHSLGLCLIMFKTTLWKKVGICLILDISSVSTSRDDVVMIS